MTSPANTSPEALRKAHLAYLELQAIVARALTITGRGNPQRVYSSKEHPR